MSGPGPKTNLLFFNHFGPTKKIWYYDVRAVGFSLTRSQKRYSENDLLDCLAMFQEYQRWLAIPEEMRPENPPLNESLWIVSADCFSQNKYDLSAHNPNQQKDFSHRPATDLIVDISNFHSRGSEIIGEIQDLLSIQEEVEAYQSVPMDNFLKIRKEFFTIRCN